MINVTAKREGNVTYLNDREFAILVTVKCSGDCIVPISGNHENICVKHGRHTLAFIVEPNQEYRVSSSGELSIESWAEEIDTENKLEKLIEIGIIYVN